MKFIVVGIWNTAVGYLVFVFLDTVFSSFVSRQYLAYMPAMIIGQIIAILNAFIFHKYVTFMSSARGLELVKEFFRFTMTYVFTFFINLIMLPVLVELLHISPRVSAAFIILVVTIISYITHSRFTFRKGKRNG